MGVGLEKVVVSLKRSLGKILGEKESMGLKFVVWPWMVIE
jgi:hypothetical protein